MNILFVTYAYPPFLEMGGPPLKIRALALGMIANGHSVTVLTADHDRARGGHVEDLDGVKVHYLPILTKYRSVPMTRGVRAFLKDELDRFDVVQIFGLYDTAGPAVARACRRRGVPYVVEPMGMAKPIVRSRLKKRLFHAVLGAPLLRHAAAVIATAPSERTELIEVGVPAASVVVRRNGIDLTPFDPLPTRGEYRRQAGIPDDVMIVLFFGRISYKKRPEEMVRAFASAGVTGRLLFVGPDEDALTDSLKRVAEDLGVADRVDFVGAVYDETLKVQILVDADLFVLPSLNENFGNSVVEAMAAGTAVIITASCGVAPLVADRAGIVVADDLAGLPDAINALASDVGRRDRCGEAGRAIAKGLTWDEPVQEQVALFEDVVAGQTIGGASP